MMEQKITEVVAALIVKDHRFLICQRPAHKARGLLWEFVGGKVEQGETLPQALIRECREELGIRVTPQEIFMQLVHTYPDITVRLTLFWAQTQDTRSVWSTTTCAGSASMKSTTFPSVPPTGIFWRSSKKWNSSRKIRSASTLSRPASSIIPRAIGGQLKNSLLYARFTTKILLKQAAGAFPFWKRSRWLVLFRLLSFYAR